MAHLNILTDYTTVSNSSTSLSTFTKDQLNITSDTDIERKILIALANETPDEILFDPNSCTVDDITEDIMERVLISNDLDESNFVFRLNFKNNTPILNEPFSQELVFHSGGDPILDPITENNLDLVFNSESLLPSTKTTSMELGPDTSALYKGFLKFEFTNGEMDYISDTQNHQLFLNPDDSDCNLFKVANAVNGIRAGFDNDFNMNHAFSTESIVFRNENNQLYTDINQTLGNDGASTVFDINLINDSPSFVPAFGSFKLNQNELEINFEEFNNTNDNSNMSILNSTTNTSIFPIDTDAPPTSMNEQEFINLFDPSSFNDIAPGYSISFSIGSNQLGGYFVNNEYNQINIPSYDSSNEKIDATNLEQMLQLDFSNIDKNYAYMLMLKNYPDLINSHQFVIQNGTFVKNIADNQNKNFENFGLFDGAETLEINSENDITDLETPGVIKVFDTNNTYNDPFSRSTSNLTYTSSIPRLVVNYEDTEQDYLEDVGVVNELIKTNYYVNSESCVLLPTTVTAVDGWTDEKDIAKADNGVLVFQNKNNGSIYDKTIITDFIATGLNEEILPENFCLIQINSSYDFTNSYDTSGLINTNTESVNDFTISSTVYLTEIDLQDILAEDIQVTLTPKTIQDMPQITTIGNSYDWNWTTSDYNTGISFVDGEIVNGNGSLLISSKDTKNYLGKDIYKMMSTDASNILNIELVLTTTEELVETFDALENTVTINLQLPNYYRNLFIERFEIFKTLYNNAVLAYYDVDYAHDNTTLVTFSTASETASASFLTALEQLNSIDPILNRVITSNSIKQNISDIKTFLQNIINDLNSFINNNDVFIGLSNYVYGNGNQYITSINTYVPLIDSYLLNVVKQNSIDRSINLDETDVSLHNIQEQTTLVTTHSVSDNVNWTVNEYNSVKEYVLAIKFKVGPYKNLYTTTRVKELNKYYRIFDTNQNKFIPDSYLIEIVDENYEQIFKASRRLIDATETEVLTQSCVTNFKVKDLMGFFAGLQYKQPGQDWSTFELQTDTLYNNSCDLLFDQTTTFQFYNPLIPDTIMGSLTLSIDSDIANVYGLIGHKNSNTDIMYIMPLSTPEGNSSFQVRGFSYNDLETIPNLNRTIEWSAYNSSNFFINNAGTELQLTSRVAKTDTPNIIQLTITNTETGTELASFNFSKWLITNFNIIYNKKHLIQHNYNIGTLYSSIRYTEYLRGTQYNTSDLFYSKLPFGATADGIRVEILPSAKRGDISYFKLLGDRVLMNPLNNQQINANTYDGLYSSLSGTEITPSSTGFPKPTESSKHRNIYTNIFRGYKQDTREISILRTKTTIKFKMGNDFEDNLDDNVEDMGSTIWKNRGVNVNNIRSLTEEFNDMGSLGLTANCNFSMFTELDIPASTPYNIPIILEFADFTKTISNPVSNFLSTITTDVNAELSTFVPYNFVATKILVSEIELFKMSYELGTLDIYFSNNYVNDPRLLTESDWGQPTEYTDDVVRQGVLLGNELYSGVVQITRSISTISSGTTYVICPPPSAYCEAYDITLITSGLVYPYDLTEETADRYYVDINTINDITHEQGISPELQNNKPFNKSVDTSIYNTLNSIPSGKGLNDLRIGFNLPNYLDLKYNTQNSFTFNILSNKLCIYSGIGSVSNDTVLEKIFDGTVDELNDTTKWIPELAEIIDNNFTSDKKWNLKIQQPLDPIANVINNNITLSEPAISINGIIQFALGNYYLQLTPLDSIFVNYYGVERNYNTSTNKVDVIFSKYSSVDTEAWGTSDNFSKCENFMPYIVTKDKFTISVSIENVLSNVRLNIDTLIKSKVADNLILADIEWVNDTSFVQQYSPIRIAPLTIQGAVFLNQMLQVTDTNSCKIIGFNRPDPFRITSADGATLTKINQDGILSTVKLSTYSIKLKPVIKATNVISNNIGIEAFDGNI